jgi:hypothetical protein
MICWHDLIGFIHSASHLNPGSMDADLIRAFLKKPVPWTALLMMAESEGASGLLYRNMKRLGGLDVPQPVLARLEDAYSQTRKTSLSAVRSAKKLSCEFQRAGLSGIALQGMSLLDLYTDPGLRPLGDIDILVKGTDRVRIDRMLYKMGFRVSDPTHPELFCKGTLWVDIHTHLLNLDRIRTRQYLFPSDLSPLWKRAIPLFAESTGLLRPDPLDNIVALSAHSLKHGYSRTIWLVDLYELLRAQTHSHEAWKAVIDRTRFWGQEKTVLFGLMVLEGLMGMQVPGWVTRELGSSRLGSVEKYLLRLRRKGFTSGEFCIPLWFYSIKGYANRMRFLLETLYPENQVMNQIFVHARNEKRIHQLLKRTGQALRMVWRNGRLALRLSLW